jgi:ADP-dependent glucokinase
MDTQNVLSQAQQIPLTITAHTNATIEAIKTAHIAEGYNGQITTVMREGILPVASSTCSGTGLVLLHGYCSAKNPWTLYDFTIGGSKGYYFMDVNASRSNDEFALLVLDFISTLNLCSYGLVGHSQGGIVSVHILNYYHSGLDGAAGDRKTQSLCSPFQGNSAAGSSSSLLSMFGSQCESINDLTPAGANTWLSGITTATRASHHYYYTRYKNDFLDNCNSMMNLLIKTPNDGVTETQFAPLPSSNNAGEFKGECHVDGMKYPGAFRNSARNAEMSVLAAR